MLLFIFLLGTIIGSFINVCIYRLPRGESVIYPPSHCPLCGYRLRPLDLIPLLSFFALRGKCRECGANISVVYPLVELLTGLMFVFAFVKFGLTLDSLTAIILISCLMISTFTDLEHQMIPDKVIFPTIVAGLMLNILFRRENLISFILGSVLGGGIILLIVILSRGGMGGGDIKLFAAVGMFLGVRLTILAMLLSFIFGSLVGLILIMLKLKNMRDAIPFGPFIALASIVSLLSGDKLISWYWDLIF